MNKPEFYAKYAATPLDERDNRASETAKHTLMQIYWLMADNDFEIAKARVYEKELLAEAEEYFKK